MAQTTITGNIKDLTGGVVSGYKVRFTLLGHNSNVPRVNGTAWLPTGNNRQIYIDFTPNSITGAVSGSIYSNDVDISVAGQTGVTFYNLQTIASSGQESPYFPVAALSGATLDISVVTPLSTTPVVAAPTGDTTYARLDGGNQPFTGAVSASNKVSGTLAMKAASTGAVIYLTAAGSDANDGLSWGSAKATLAAAISAIPSQGGTIYFSGTIAQNTALTLKSNLNIIGMGSAQIDSVTGPATITTTLGSGDLFYFNAFSDCRLADFSIKNTAASGANSAIRLTAAQRNSFERIYISGAFARGVQLDSSSVAVASCIWNSFREIHVTGLATNGIALLLDSADATNKVINSNFFYNFQATGGTSGVGIKLTNSGVHNQVINENVFFASEATAATGTAILVDQGSTRGCMFIDVNAEGCTVGVNKATTNTLAFIGGNISSNGTNVTDAQPSFTIFEGTNVGGTVQTFAITPLGGIYAAGLALGGSAPQANAIGGATGWVIQASGTTVVTVNNTGVTLGGTIPFNRIRANQGSALVSGDFAIGAGFGNTASISAISGTDAGGTFTITANGTGLAANPSVTLTFHDGTWTVAPVVVAGRGDVNTAGHLAAVASPTAVQFTLNSTPTAGLAFVFNFICVGK